MAGTLMLVNPRKRHRRGRKAKSRHSRRRHHNPHRARRHSRARRRNPMHFFKRHRKHRARRHSRARRRNPIGLRSFIPSGGITGQLMGAVKGAAGALVVDAAYTYIPLPAMLKTGTLASVTRVAVAFLSGWL